MGTTEIVTDSHQYTNTPDHDFNTATDDRHTMSASAPFTIEVSPSGTLTRNPANPNLPPNSATLINYGPNETGYIDWESPSARTRGHRTHGPATIEADGTMSRNTDRTHELDNSPKSHAERLLSNIASVTYCDLDDEPLN